jgi:hypothetical protein
MGNPIFRAIGFVVRIPGFVLAVAIWTVVGIPWVVVMIAWNVLIIPLVFIGAAYANDRGRYERHLSELREAPSLIGKIYRDAGQWLVGNRSSIL